jgi:hypothetical protein
MWNKSIEKWQAPFDMKTVSRELVRDELFAASVLH